MLKVLRGGYAQFDRIVKFDTPLGDDWLTPLYVKIDLPPSIGPMGF
ncbi:hypothetical protein [Burkholderia pseudomallei]|nr:hypothetical protein [Burkholderia pseudomallei]